MLVTTKGSLRKETFQASEMRMEVVIVEKQEDQSLCLVLVEDSTHSSLIPPNDGFFFSFQVYPCVFRNSRLLGF